MRVFAISDLHTDFEANWQELRECSTTEYRDDLLIVAGDIADRMAVIEKTLLFFRKIFRHVFYTPGNHELWSKRESKTSPEKLEEILKFCGSAGIEVRAARIGNTAIVPLFSWYETAKIPQLLESDETLMLWSDFYFCVWDSIDGCASDYMSELNRPISSFADCEQVISFSHFLPRRELLPDMRRVAFKGLEHVSVCPQLLPQIQQIGSQIHVFGHTHIKCDREIDGVRYIQNAFGYPREKGFKRPEVFKMIARID